MAPHLPGPWIVTLHTEEDGLGHNYRYNCDVVVNGDPGDAMSAFSFRTSSYGVIQADTAIQAFCELFAHMFFTSTTFVETSLWKVTEGGYGTDWYSTYDPDLLGQVSGTVIPASEEIFTFRTSGGGLLRITVEEGIGDDNLRTPINTLITDEKALCDYIIGSNNWILGADNTYPLAGLFRCRGQNEAIWRKRYRS